MWTPPPPKKNSLCKIISIEKLVVIAKHGRKSPLEPSVSVLGRARASPKKPVSSPKAW